MGKRSKVLELPAAVREWLDTALAGSNFAGYEQLERELSTRGFAVSKSSIHRYGSQLEQKLAAIKASTEAAALIAKVAPDDADLRSSAVMSMLQTQLFEVMVLSEKLKDEGDPAKRMKLLSSLATSVAKLSRASVNQKKHEIETRGKAQSAADKVARLAKRGGLSGGTVDQIKREILGIAG